jgi:hypothetical protein
MPNSVDNLTWIPFGLVWLAVLSFENQVNAPRVWMTTQISEFTQLFGQLFITIWREFYSLTVSDFVKAND